MISRQIDYLGKMPAVTSRPVRTSKEAKEMLRFDLENEKTKPFAIIAIVNAAPSYQGIKFFSRCATLRADIPRGYHVRAANGGSWVNE